MFSPMVVYGPTPVWSPGDAMIRGRSKKISLERALTYREGHLCKGDPTEITEFNLQSSSLGFSSYFVGMLDVDIDVVPGSTWWPQFSVHPDSNNNKNKCSEHSFKVTLENVDNRMYSGQSSNGNVVNQTKKRKLDAESLSDAMISKLARKISVQSMSVIAIETLGFTIDDLKNLKAGYREDVYLINIDILCAWRNKSGENSREALKKHLLEAASGDGLLNPSDIETIMGST